MAVRLENDTTAQPEQMEEQISWLLGKKEPTPYVGDYHTDSKIRPPFDYATLCAKAILSCPEERGTLSELYAYISGSFPYYAQSWTCWQNSIRHTLSHHKCFVRVEGASRDGRNKHCRFWTISEEMRACFTDEGIYINNKSRRRVRSVAGKEQDAPAVHGAKKRPAKRCASLPEATTVLPSPQFARSASLPNTLPALPTQAPPHFNNFYMPELPSLGTVTAQTMTFRTAKPEPQQYYVKPEQQFFKAEPHYFAKAEPHVHYYPVKVNVRQHTPPTPPTQLSSSPLSVSPANSPLSYYQSPMYGSVSSPLEVEATTTWIEPLSPLFDDYLTNSAFQGLKTDIDWTGLANLLGLEA